VNELMTLYAKGSISFPVRTPPVAAVKHLVYEAVGLEGLIA
jgi:hypothetical protein